MKGPVDRTKVVLRHLPPSISQAALVEQIDVAFAGRYNWLAFRPGKSSQKNQLYSRAYIDFKKPDDVIEFAEFFDGHVFVNEKGTQYKTVVEYAPSQRVPKQWSKRDGREGTLLKDPEYLEFVEFVAKPVENLPSAEIQLERREAERAGTGKEPPIITPLMDFVRQKRAAKNVSRRSLPNGKLSRRSAGATGGTSTSSRRGSEKKRMSTTMYVLRDGAKTTIIKDKSGYVLASKRDNQQVSEKASSVASAAGTEALEAESVVPGNLDTTKKKVLLLKGKERDSHVIISDHQTVTTSPVKIPPRQNQRREGSGRLIRSILLNRDARHNQPSSGIHSEQQPMQTSNFENNRRPPRPPNTQFLSKDTNGAPEDRIVGNDKLERRGRNKDRPDRGVWAPLRRSDGSHASDESLSSSASQLTQASVDSSEGSYGDIKADMSTARSGEFKLSGTGRGAHLSSDNGSHKHSNRRTVTHFTKDVDGSFMAGDAKPSRRGGSSGYGSNEKQVWVQKSSSGS